MHGSFTLSVMDSFILHVRSNVSRSYSRILSKEIAWHSSSVGHWALFILAKSLYHMWMNMK